jgi:hypothetical protein
MRRDHGMEDPRVVAGVPVSRTTGMSTEEFAQLQRVTSLLAHARERIVELTQTVDGAYSQAEIARLMCKQQRRAMDLMIWVLMAVTALVVASLITFMYKM